MVITRIHRYLTEKEVVFIEVFTSGNGHPIAVTHRSDVILPGERRQKLDPAYDRISHPAVTDSLERFHTDLDLGLYHNGIEFTSEKYKGQFIELTD